MREVEDPAVQPLLAGGLRRRVADVLRQPFQVRRVRQVQGEGVRGVEHVLAELEFEQRELFLEFAVGLLVRLGQQGAAAHEVLVAVFQQFALVGGQVQRGAGVVDGLDACEQLGVQGDIEFVSGQQGRDLLGGLLHPVVAFGFQ